MVTRSQVCEYPIPAVNLFSAQYNKLMESDRYKKTELRYSECFIDFLVSVVMKLQYLKSVQAHIACTCKDSQLQEFEMRIGSKIEILITSFKDKQSIAENAMGKNVYAVENIRSYNIYTFDCFFNDIETIKNNPCKNESEINNFKYKYEIFKALHRSACESLNGSVSNKCNLKFNIIEDFIKGA